MRTESLGWRGKRLKHIDGRTGIILRENVGGWWCSLTIEVDGQEATESIDLDGTGSDSGAVGWQWNRALPGEPDRWVLLGDHNPARLQLAA